MIYSFEYMMGAHCFEVDWHRKADKDFPEFGVITVYSSAPNTFQEGDSIQMLGRQFLFFGYDPPGVEGSEAGEHSYYFSYSEKIDAGAS